MKIPDPIKSAADRIGKIGGTGIGVLAKRASQVGGAVVALPADSVGLVRDVNEAVSKTWLIAIFVTLGVIHYVRMGIDLTLWALLAPLVVTGADLVCALLLGSVGLGILRVAYRFLPNLSARFEQLTMGRLENLLVGIDFRFSDDTMFRDHRRSWEFARKIELGLLPVVAVVAISPAWGFTWYFNSENWGAGLRHVWAEWRTDGWRVGYVNRARNYRPSLEGSLENRLFAVEPPGVQEQSFCFVVIGDTGEGDASQFALHHQLLKVTQEPAVKFALVSSDVVYPSGEMKDYESKFYLPFKGITQPIYALPGNHDWYDRLEAFIANFYEPDIAQAALQAGILERVLALLTSNRLDRLPHYIEEAKRLRTNYGLKTAQQRSMYFRMRNDYFLLLVVDTGTGKQVDAEQFDWFENELENAGDRFKMVVLGHPVFVHGEADEASENFQKIYERLKQHRVDVVMAGDTHDFEYYAAQYQSGAENQEGIMHHFVNGGGAFLSLGTALHFPGNLDPAIGDYVYYPRGDILYNKLHAESWWKRPLLWWTGWVGEWPISTSSAFDYNKSPFFQSFANICVENVDGTTKTVITPYGTNGPLQWREVASSQTPNPASAADRSGPTVKFTVERREVTR